MTKRELLLKKIKENNGVITTKEALNIGIYKDILKELTIKEELEKIANGLYDLPDESIDEYLYFSYRIPKGILSHETSAYLQGLSTRMPLAYVMTVKVGDNVSRVKSARDNIIFKYVKKDYYYIGKMAIISPFGREISVYDKERTILDIIKDKDRIDSQVFSEAIKSYFADKEKNLLKLSKYAIKMNMEEELKLYTEVLLWKHRNRLITTTRARDFYDLYMIYSIYKDKINKDTLRKAIERTSKYRGSLEMALQYKEIVELFKESEAPKELWGKYVQNNLYAKDVDFLDTISVYKEIGDVLNINDNIK